MIKVSFPSSPYKLSLSAPPSIVSAPLPPYKLSLPANPYSLSSLAPAKIELFAELPYKVSAALEPRICSNPLKVSLPSPLAVFAFIDSCVTLSRLTFTDEIELEYTTQSSTLAFEPSTSSPNKVSFPSPPSI